MKADEKQSFNHKIFTELENINKPVSIFWFRRDLRLDDNCGLYHALKSGVPVLPLFIFDTNILKELDNSRDARVTFIYNELKRISEQLKKQSSSIIVLIGEPVKIWRKLADKLRINSVYANHDYEPYARERDLEVEELLNSKKISFNTFKDQVIFEKDEILSASNQSYTIFTPYKKRWLREIRDQHLKRFPSETKLSSTLTLKKFPFPSMDETGFKYSTVDYPDRRPDINVIKNYHLHRDFPAKKGTTRIGIHLRFGTISVRSLVEIGLNMNEVWLSELIWREFFMMILWHYPHVINRSFNSQYDKIKWRTDPEDFRLWCEGKTGYPLVDAGMRELISTGFMHNRVRMISASFLTKHLLIDWRRGERYFAKKLLDYELSSNNGNWQWAAGCGCDAAPYFRIFNPELQLNKFDPDMAYVKKWIPEFGSKNYPGRMVDHKSARERALSIYKAALDKD